MLACSNRTNSSSLSGKPTKRNAKSSFAYGGPADTSPSTDVPCTPYAPASPDLLNHIHIYISIFGTSLHRLILDQCAACGTQDHKCTQRVGDQKSWCPSKHALSARRITMTHKMLPYPRSVSLTNFRGRQSVISIGNAAKRDFGLRSRQPCMVGLRC